MILTKIKKPYKIDTFKLIRVFLKNKIHYNNFYFLGLKDKQSISNQYLILNIKVSGKVLYLLTKYNISYDKIGYINHDYVSKDLVIGNEFKIFMWGTLEQSFLKNFFKSYSPIEFPNFYGYQRFGINRINHVIGKTILKSSSNAIEALNITLKPLIKLYINAYQAYLFNRVLSRRIIDNYPLNKCIRGDYCVPSISLRDIFICKEKMCRGKPIIPLIGYGYIPKNRLLDKYYIELLKEEDIKPRDFYLNFKGMKFFGGFRFASLNLKNLYVIVENDKKGILMSFFMSRGMYATIFLRELIKPRFPSKYGF